MVRTILRIVFRFKRNRVSIKSPAFVIQHVNWRRRRDENNNNNNTEAAMQTNSSSRRVFGKDLTVAFNEDIPMVRDMHLGLGVCSTKVVFGDRELPVDCGGGGSALVGATLSDLIMSRANLAGGKPRTDQDSGYYENIIQNYWTLPADQIERGK